MENELPDLFPGYESVTIEAAGTGFYCRIGGSGPPLLLLHGYPQSHVIWHKIAPLLDKHFTLVLPDLPGYGQSSVPPMTQDHWPYSKRCIASSLVEMMRGFGHERFFLAGHDRGGRVAYRMALDTPDALERLAVLDILPTSEYWDRMDRTFGLKIYHWTFLAQPAPFPEELISSSPIHFLEHTLASWTAEKNLTCFSEAAMIHNRAWFRDPDRIAATCEDYRAGATIDYLHDKADQEAGNIIQKPLLALWGGLGIATSVDDPLSVWRPWCPQAIGAVLDCGHFLPEESPHETAEHLLNFLLS
ncbi:alpha/beta hydrolase [Labrenzia aggregata]|uniref:Alpha/beta hydrolase n=1 Tax=Roseibium aggregatum TaxID=187304 RepID=A0A939ECI5_9HYPH|nr:alpha/beta hydrolase [Roseibium aggregatum]